MEEKNNEDELHKKEEEELEKWASEQRQKSIEMYGRDIYTDKNIGNKGIKKINSKIDFLISVLHVLIPIVVVIILIWGLVFAWGPVANKF
jgi:hypothetical protein